MFSETDLVKLTNALLLNLKKTKSSFILDLVYQLLLILLIVNYFRFLKEDWVSEVKFVAFFNCYLSSRSQKVLIDGEYLMPRTIQTDFPQGTVLGPVLFPSSGSSG